MRPGEKAKIHWHLERIASADTNQSVALDLTVRTGGRTEAITVTLVWGSEPSNIVAAATPEPTQELHEKQQSTSNDNHTGIMSPAAVSNIRCSLNGTTWSPNGAPPDCSEPMVLQTPVDISKVTSALWPGQQRGAYVAHGGFRFDATSGNDVTVRAPLGSHLVQAS